MCKKPVFLVVVMFTLSGAMACMAQDPDPAMLGWWKLDDGAGDIAADSSGRANHGTITNLSGGLGTDGNVWVQDLERGTVLSFDGSASGAYVRAGEIPQMTLANDFTWAFWAFQDPANTTPNDIILGNRHDDAGVDFSPRQFIKFTPTKFEWHMNGVGTDDLDYDDLPGGEWLHHTVVKTGDQLTYYRNGKQAGSGTITQALDGPMPLFFGGENTNSAGENWRGMLSDIRLYERALTADEVKQLAFRPKARLPEPAHGATGVVMALLQWTAGDSAMFHDVYFGTTPELTEADRVASRQIFAMYFHPTGLEPGVTYYWRVDEIEADAVTLYTGDVWSFTAMPVTAWAPEPDDGAEQILLAPELSWSAGLDAMGHHLYFGSDPDAVAAGTTETDMGATDGASYQVAAPLEVGTTYYWRVDETDAGGSVTQTGEVWSFTTIDAGPGGAIREWWLGVTGSDIPTLTGNARFPNEPDGRELLAAMDGPVDWAENYGSRIYGWLFPPETGDYTFWVAGDDNCELWLSTDEDPANVQMIANVGTWTAHQEWYKETTQTSQPQALVAGQRYYIEALMNEGTGGDSLAVAWQGPGIPMQVIGGAYVGPTSLPAVRAYAPFPADGALDTIQAPILSWSAGTRATQHDVYFGQDAAAVADANTATADVYQGRQAITTFNPGPLEWGKTYYWRIDEINPGDAESPWVGRVWTFSTADYILIDDFESYSNEVGSRVFQVWVDGLGYSEPAPGHPGNGTGALVGHDVWTIGGPHYQGTIVETGNAHDSAQALPLYYDNATMPYYSEAERTWTSPQDWTVQDVNALSLWFRGEAANEVAPLYVAVEDSLGNVGVSAHPNPDAVLTGPWTLWKIALSDFADAGVNLGAVKKMYLGVGNRNVPAPDGAGVVYFDDIRVTRPKPEEAGE